MSTKCNFIAVVINIDFVFANLNLYIQEMGEPNIVGKLGVMKNN